MSRIRELFELADRGGPRTFEILAEISRLRRQTARSLLEMDGDEAALSARLADIADFAVVGFPWERSVEDEEIAAAIAAAWGDDDAPSARALMASMALAPAHHFAKPRSLGVVPPWLRRLYATHLIVRPPIFAKVGEAEQYVAHGAAAMRLLAAAIIDEHLPEAEALADVVANYDSTMTYFSEGSLKDLFAQKARIIESLLLARGHRLGWSFPFDADRPLRIGLVHRTLGPGAESAYLLAHLAGRDKSKAVVTIYAWGDPRPDMVQAFAPWVSNIVRLPDDDTLGSAMRLRRDQLDICYFATNIVCSLGIETTVAAHKVARVQMVGGASPASPGYLSADLFISGQDCDPDPKAQNDYEEQLAYLPGALRSFAFTYDREPNTVRCTREAFGIPADHVIFFSAANYYKHTPEITAIWAQILARAPKSSLVLMPFNPNWGDAYPVDLFMRRLHGALARAGVSADRVKVVEKVRTRSDLHALISKADVYLDSFPYSGACSLVDPLSVGIPIVARAGRRLRTAQGAALVAAEGLDVSPDAQSYVERAVRLATDEAFRREALARAQGVAAAPPACLRTQPFAQRFERLCGDVHSAYAARYAALRAGTAAKAKAAVLDAVASAQGYGSPVFRHSYGIDIVARLLVPYLRTLARDGRAAGRVADVGSMQGDLAAPFCRARFQADMLEPDPSFADALNSYAKQFPELAYYDAAPLSVRSPAAAKAGKARGALAPTPALRKHLADAEFDIVRFDAERIGFPLDASFDLIGDATKLVMAEFTGAHSDAAARGLKAMKARGFDSVLLTYRDLTALGLENWRRELVDVVLDPSKIAVTGLDSALILFFKKGDTTFLAYLAQFLEACAPAQVRPWLDGAAFTRRQAQTEAARSANPVVTA